MKAMTKENSKLSGCGFAQKAKIPLTEVVKKLIEGKRPEKFGA